MMRTLFKGRSDTLRVLGYKIDTTTVIGQGAYGVVYRALYPNGQKVAAKRIDTSRHPLLNIAEYVQKLKQLDHPNIVHVYDIHQEEKAAWMFMELCEHEDLNKFYAKNELTQEQLLTIMQQIAAGVKYLHQNDIVHRDIKPENILVADNSPILIKLTDFDLCKFFEESFETSAMSTNVGTLAFKAPEFFQRTPEGKLVYHRNVDVYAMGLTFLALLQTIKNKGAKQLKPQIETPQEDSEKFAYSIGQLIAERMKYKVKELRVVALDNVESEDDFPEAFTHDVKELIQKMT